jgi:hypothetical protein
MRPVGGPLPGTPNVPAVPPRLEEMFAELNGLSPQREAAFFYGLFLRGHSVESLRRDIDVDPVLLAKWRTLQEREPLYREAIEIIVPYRKRVLAIFESLITSERRQPTRLN